MFTNVDLNMATATSNRLQNFEVLPPPTDRTYLALRCNFLGVRVRLVLFCVIRTAIAPARELAGTLLLALLGDSTGILRPVPPDQDAFLNEEPIQGLQAHR